MKKLFLTLSLLIMAALPLQAKAETVTDKAILYAVAFHADWCGGCKVLGPNIKKARGQADLDNKNVLFIKLDLTDATTRHQATLMASVLGLEDFYKENNGKTGFVLLVNSKTGETLGKLTKDMDSKQIITMIKEKMDAI